MVESLRAAILSGRYPTDSYIPTELELGAAYSLSKLTVRKGLDVLVGEGLIGKVPRIGAKVIWAGKREAEVVRFGYYESALRDSHILELVELFERQHPHVKVQPVPMPFARTPEAITDFVRTSGCDALMLNNTDFGLLKEAEAGHELAAVEPDEDVYPFLNKPFVAENVQYVRPFQFSPVVLCYNKDHFRETGLAEPDSGWSWEDLRSAGRRLAGREGRYGFFFHLLSDNRWPLFLLQNGVRVERDVRGKADLRGNGKLVRGLQACKELIGDKILFPSYLSENDADAENIFLRRKVSMILVTYASLNALEHAPFAYDLSPLPYDGPNAATLVFAIGLALTRKGVGNPAAALLRDYLLSFETQLHLRRRTMSLPALKAAAEWSGTEAETGIRPSRFGLFREIISTYRFADELNLGSREIAEMRNGLKDYWSGFESLDTALRRTEERLEEIRLDPSVGLPTV